MCSNGAATAACSPKDIYIDSPKEQGSWLRKVRLSGEYSNVSIVVDNQTFHLHMLPLLQESLHLKEIFSSRGVSKDQPPGTDMAIELPNFPGGAVIFSKAMDFCYSMDVKFSTSNIAALMAASKYLGMDNLMKKAEEFLDRIVYRNWRNCLLLWSSIDQKDPYVFSLFNGRLNEVTKKCERGFLDCIATKNDVSGQLWCNIRDIREMVALSSPNLASRVFQALVDANVGLFYVAAEHLDSAANNILLYQPCPSLAFPSLPLDSNAHPAAPSTSHHCVTAPINRFTDRAAWKPVCERYGGEAILWLKSLPMALTSEWQRAMFYRYIGEWMMQGVEGSASGKCGDRDSPPLVLEGFFLSLLVEATKLVTRSPAKQFPGELMAVINRLKTFRNVWLMRVDLKWLANTVSRSELDHFSFEILQAVSKKISEVHGSSQQKGFHHSQQLLQLQSQSHSQQQPNTSGNYLMLGGNNGCQAKIERLIKAGNPLFYAEKAATNFEESLLLQLKKKTLSVDQVLTLLQEFPAALRSSHESLYRTLEQVSKVKPLTAAEQDDVNKILDYRMVSDEVVKAAFRNPKLGFSHSLLSRAMELEISKLDRVRLHYDQDEDCLSSREQLVRSRKSYLILEKALRTHMRASMLLSERYRSLEEKVDALSRSSS